MFSQRESFAVRGVNFSLREGEFVAVLGHNGSGKSTLARLTNGLLKPTSGKITTFGMDTCDEKNLFAIRKNIGIIFQNPDNQTVASIVEDDVAFGPENIGLPREEIGKRIDFSLRAVGMDAFRYGTPNHLSGGQKQRIAIASVLALKPRVIILDESTAMLDPQGRKEVMDVITRLHEEEGIAVILITHFPEEALLADRAILMHEGRIVSEGTPQALFKEEQLLKKCGLLPPRSIRICRSLTAGGLPVKDGMDVENVAKNVLSALQNLENVGAPKRANSAEEIKTEGVCTRTTCEKKEDSESGRVVIENLSYVYNPDSPFETYALNGVDLEINAGDFFGVIGHTGSGKSTFVQHLNALLKVPSAHKKYKEKKRRKGEVVPVKPRLLVNGFDLTDKNTDFRALRSKVGMVFQYPEYQLFAETVFEDVAFGLRNFYPNYTEAETIAAVQEALNRVGLCYDEVKNRSPFELSGGQKRRVAIAGVIVTKPEILILDEPAAGLDPQGKEEIMALLHDLHADWCKTVIIVSHDMDEIAENCTRAAVFSEGRVLATGTPKSLFAKTELLFSKGLDIPFTAKVLRTLRENGVEISSNLRMEDFVEKILQYTKTMGAGMQSLAREEKENA